MSTPTAAGPGLPATAPGWTRQDYADHGITGRDSSRQFRALHLPPATAALLREHGYPLTQIMQMAREVPSWMLHRWASTGWLAGASTFTVTQARAIDSVTLDAWANIPQSTLEDALHLEMRGIDRRSAHWWSTFHRSPIAFLRTRLIRPDLTAVPSAHVADHIAADPNGWLSVAVLDAKTRHRTGNWTAAAPPATDEDPGIGGLTGLWAAAGTSPTQAQNEARTGVSPEHVAALHLTAVLACPDPLPPLDWWLTR